MKWRHLIAAATFALLSSGANATLTSNTAASDGLVFSSISDATWTKDGNLLGSMIEEKGFDAIVNAIISVTPVIYDTNNTYTLSGTYIITSNDFSALNLGRTNWYGAIAFINYLNSIKYSGSNQWRLPDVGVNPQSGYNQIDSEFGQLYYSELNKTAITDTNNNDFGILGNGELETSGAVGPFVNVQTYVYWAARSAYPPEFAYAFAADQGFQAPGGKLSPFYAWAITDGHLVPVPVPSAAWLMGSILFLTFIKRKVNATNLT